jgi:signal transduction histidine kinase
MIYPEPHAEETRRLQALDEYAILDTPKEQAYDDLTAIAAKIFQTPISLVSLLDKNRQWFKSNHGLNVRETPKEYAFCAHAINSTEEIFIVPDSRKDPRFSENPIVNGEPHVIFYAGVPLYDDNNLPLGTLCVIDNKPRQLSSEEMSALKALANQVLILLKNRKLTKELNDSIQKLSERNNDLAQFANVAAHDLKSPLINISAISQYLSNNYASRLDEEGKTLISLIQRSADTLRSLIDDTLNYYKDEHKIRREAVFINLEEFYHQIFELFNHNQSISLKLITSVKQIRLNSTILSQIMINLISNAIRYNDKKNIVVHIGVIDRGEFLEFYVKDNGPGINEDLHQKVFELFSVGIPHDNDGRKGKGIGLATVKKLVELLEGKIWLENGKENGCKFIFQIRK